MTLAHTQTHASVDRELTIPHFTSTVLKYFQTKVPSGSPEADESTEGVLSDESYEANAIVILPGEHVKWLHKTTSQSFT